MGPCTPDVASHVPLLLDDGVGLDDDGVFEVHVLGSGGGLQLSRGAASLNGHAEPEGEKRKG